MPLTEAVASISFPQYVVHQLVALLIVGVALAIAMTLGRRPARGVPRRWREISPEAIVGHKISEEPLGPELLCHQIVQRARQLHRALQENPTEIEVEMCVMGYRACVEAMGLLMDIIAAELPVSGPLRRMRLTRTWRKAAEEIFRVQEAFPASAVRLIYQERR